MYNVPVVGFDGTHSRHHKFNGVMLYLIGRDGNRHNVTLSTSFVNVENKDNVSWFFINFIRAGINLMNAAIMCDRGKIQDAMKQVYAITGIILQIRFYTLHVLRNIKRNFGCSGSKFEKTVWKIQSEESEIDYNAALTTVRSKFGDDVSTYIGDTDLIYWTVFVNMQMKVVNENLNVKNFTTSSTNSATSTHHQDLLAPPMKPCSFFWVAHYQLCRNR